MVSMFAIDALRQLSFKFLEKPEKHDFSFQRLFLQPFAVIMASPVSREDIRELVLRCVDNMIRSKGRFIRSGWKTIFTILRLSADDSSVRITSLGLDVLTRLLDEHFDELCNVKRESADDEDAGDKSSFEAEIERKNRTAGAEDFVRMIGTSLSFICYDKEASDLAPDLCMRALIHLACYADVIQSGRVLPPPGAQDGWHSVCQTRDRHAAGYTYPGLAEGEAETMMLWRPLIDGLCAGISSPRTGECTIQRASAVSLRLILLRHGGIFSPQQWVAVLGSSILPTLQKAAEKDKTKVSKITSESPTVSSLDFLLTSLPLPPVENDETLHHIAMQAQSEDVSASRHPGSAETLVEASLYDLKKGGDGSLLQFDRVPCHDKHVPEEPFPDSWIATTAGVSMGMVTDIFSQFILPLGADGMNLVWPLIKNQLNMWILGFSNLNRRPSLLRWKPCEALVRIGCLEFGRISCAIAAAVPQPDKPAWASTILRAVAETLHASSKWERSLHEDCVTAKLEALDKSSNEKSLLTRGSLEEEDARMTCYGKGRFVRKRDDAHAEVEQIELEWGAMLYQTTAHSSSFNGSKYEKWHLTQENIIEKYVPALKVRSIAAYLLLDHFQSWFSQLSPFLSSTDVQFLVGALESSKASSSNAGADTDLAHAFHEAMMCDWDNDVEAIEAALAVSGGNSFSLGGSSAGFFFSQEAASTSKLLLVLFDLYKYTGDVEATVEWDREAFSESLLLETIVEVLTKFIRSERTEGRFVDPMVWRQQNKNTGRSPMFCTSFVGVVEEILEKLSEFEPQQFEKHISKIFSLLCALIQIQSEEIRSLVEKILSTKVGAILGISTKEWM